MVPCTLCYAGPSACPYLVVMSRSGVEQVNHSPSFTCDTPFDHKIKFTLVRCL